MRIIQITDLHVGREGEDTFNVDIRSNFLKIKEAILQYKPDHIVITGDLCYREADKTVYEWLKKHLDAINIPYDVISGNHDEPVLLSEVFKKNALLKNGELYFEKVFNGIPSLFLDTTYATVSQQQLSWLKEKLASFARETLIFMHHPPFLADVPFMDRKHALQNRDEVNAIFFKHPYPVAIFTGHYHVEKTILKENVTLNITPSTFFQIDAFEEDFKVDHYQIGLRIIELKDDKISYTLRYLSGK